MDLSRGVTYRGVDINALAALVPGEPLVGYMLNEARFQPVEGFGYSEKRSLGDGYDYGRVFLGRRSLLLRGTIYGDTRADMHDRVRIIRALFTPTLAYAADPANKGFLPMTFSLPTEDVGSFPTGLIPVSLFVRPEDQPGAFFARTASGGEEGEGFSEVYEVSLVARDPRFYAQTDTQVVATALTGSGATVNKGDYPTPLQVTLVLSGATSGPRTFTLVGFGSTMTVTIPNGAVTRTVRVDGEKKVCTLIQGGVETLRMDLVDFESANTWPMVQPGSNNYDWTSTGGVRSTGSMLWYREAFV